MNREHLRRLRKRPDAWNAWRGKSPSVRPDLSNAVINMRATKTTAFSHKSAFNSFMTRDLRGLDFHDVNLKSAKIWLSGLDGVDLRGADLSFAEVRHTSLNRADMSDAVLIGTQFIISSLQGACFNNAVMGDTHFGFTALNAVTGLDSIRHSSPSHIDQFSLINSPGIPQEFVRAFGVSPVLLRLMRSYAQEGLYKTCFISYSRHDEEYVECLREWLTENSVPSWFAPHDMRSTEFQGDDLGLERDLFAYIDAADCFILVVSPHILPSSWVGREVLRGSSRLRPKRIIALVIDEMPSPGSKMWNALIAKTMLDPKSQRFQSEWYSAALQDILNGVVLETRGSADYGGLLSWLKKRADE